LSRDTWGIYLHYQIKAKLGVDNDIELTRLAISWGLDLSLAIELDRQ
jgi:hypothetical protein